MFTGRYRDSGFHLVELLVVVLIIGILTSISVASYALAVSDSRKIECESNRRILADAARVFQAEHGHPPDSLADLEPYVRSFERTTHCPADVSVEFDWDSARGIAPCEVHPEP